MRKKVIYLVLFLWICIWLCGCNTPHPNGDTAIRQSKENPLSEGSEENGDPREESHMPVIYGTEDIYTVKGRWVDYLRGIRAYDALGQELTDQIVVDASGVVTDEAGEYELVYRVEDLEGNRTEVSVTVHVVEGEEAVGVILEEYRPAFVRIGYSLEDESSLGSGFIVEIREAGILLLTNAHVVGEQETVDVFFYSGESVQGEVTESRMEPDMALVSVPHESVNEDLLSRLKTVEMDIGHWNSLDPTDLPAAGYCCLNPDGTLWFQETGKLLAKEELFWAVDYPVVRYSAQNRKGASGSAVLDESGKLIAMALGVSTEGDKTENWGIGLPDLVDFYYESIDSLQYDEY